MSAKRLKSAEGATKLVITPTSEELTKTKERVLKRLVQGVKVAGFRPGKAPANLVEKQLDQQLLASEFIDELVGETYDAAIKELSLSPLTPPSISLKKFVPFTDVEYEAVVLTTQDIKLADYKKIKKTLPAAKVSDKDVSEVLTNLRQRAAKREAVKRPIKNGDEIVIDFSGKDSAGKAVNGTTGKDYPLLIGSDTFIPGFEANLHGLKVGEEKTFTLNFPKDYRIKALAGRKVTFEVKVKAVNELVLPEANDEFAKQLGPFKSIDDLKEDIQKQLLNERNYQQRKDLEADIVRHIIKKSDLPAPDALLNEQIERDLVQLKQNLAYRGQTLQEFLDIEQISEEEYKTKVLKPAAEDKVKGGLVLSAIAEKENLFITPEEFEVRLQQLKGQYQDPAMQAELEKPENRREIFSRLLTEKTLATIVRYSTEA